jgi:hypothetical protein
METGNNENEDRPLPKRIGIGELARLLGVSRSTTVRHVKTVPDLGERLGHLFNERQTNKIYRHFGMLMLALGHYFVALLAGLVVVVIYKMETSAEGLIRRLFQYYWRGVKPDGSKPMSIFRLSVAIVQIILTIAAFLAAGYFVGEEIFGQGHGQCQRV